LDTASTIEPTPTGYGASMNWRKVSGRPAFSAALGGRLASIDRGHLALCDGADWCRCFLIIGGVKHRLCPPVGAALQTHGFGHLIIGSCLAIALVPIGTRAILAFRPPLARRLPADAGSFEHPPPRLLCENAREVVCLTHPFARRLVALPVALDNNPLSFQRVIDLPHDDRHALARQFARGGPPGPFPPHRPPRDTRPPFKSRQGPVP